MRHIYVEWSDSTFSLPLIGNGCGIYKSLFVNIEIGKFEIPFCVIDNFSISPTGVRIIYKCGQREHKSNKNQKKSQMLIKKQ